MIRVSEVRKSFPSRNGEPDLLVIDGLSLEVREREFVSILGPSGSGKTTILFLIAGLTEPDSGTITVKGMEPRAARRARKFGVVFQDPVLLAWRTVKENVELPGDILRDPEVKARVRDAISLVGLEGFERAFPHELSGGMRSRVAIARALALQPEVLLLDEPFADLDEITRSRLNLELLRICKETDATDVFVTHSIQEAAFLSDRVVVITSRPATAIAEQVIHLPRPRTLEMMESAPFVEAVTALRTAIGQGNPRSGNERPDAALS